MVTDKLVADQIVTSLSDAFRYMPGVGWRRQKATATPGAARQQLDRRLLRRRHPRRRAVHPRDTYNLGAWKR